MFENVFFSPLKKHKELSWFLQGFLPQKKEILTHEPFKKVCTQIFTVRSEVGGDILQLFWQCGVDFVSNNRVKVHNWPSAVPHRFVESHKFHQKPSLPIKSVLFTKCNLPLCIIHFDEGFIFRKMHSNIFCFNKNRNIFGLYKNPSYKMSF